MKEEDLAPLMEMAEKAAAKNLPAAEMKLAEVLQEGRGVPKDLRRAALILQQQAEAGVADALSLAASTTDHRVVRKSGFGESADSG